MEMPELPMLLCKLNEVLDLLLSLISADRNEAADDCGSLEKIEPILCGPLVKPHSSILPCRHPFLPPDYKELGMSAFARTSVRRGISMMRSSGPQLASDGRRTF